MTERGDVSIRRHLCAATLVFDLLQFTGDFQHHLARCLSLRGGNARLNWRPRVGLPFGRGRRFSTALKVRWMNCDTGVAVVWWGNGKFSGAVLFVRAACGRARAVTGVHFVLL